MAHNPSLTEYVAQSQRGLYQSVFGPGFLAKGTITDVFQSGTAGDTLSVNSVFNTTYGRKVWQALNNQTRFFNAIPRVVWGNTAGWRIRTDRGNNRSHPVAETGDLPNVSVSNLESISSLPRIVATTFGASVKSVFVAQLEGGVGDVLALENENSQLDHVKEINEELLAASNFKPAGGSDTTITVADADAKYWKIGDTLYLRDNDASSAIRTAAAITGKTSDGTTTTFTHAGFSGGSITPATADTIFVNARGGITSLDDVVMQDAQPVHGTAWATATDGVKVYSFGAAQARAGGSWAAGAHVSYNGGTGRDLSLNLIDTCIQKIRENGGEPKLILMGHDQYFKLERLLNSQQRYMGQEEYQVGIGSERTFPGTRTGLVLATYMGIPILPDADVARSATGSGAGSNVYVLDTDYLEMAVAQPTQYVENRDYFAANQLVVRGLLYTMGEMRCKNFFVQAKIGDLNA